MADAADPSHAECCSQRDRWLRDGGILFTTDYVVDETLTLIRFRMSLRAAGEWWDQVEASSRIRWEPISTERSEAARRWFFRWADKDFSFTDCTSFVVMREFRLRLALTTDPNFQPAGFDVLP